MAASSKMTLATLIPSPLLAWHIFIIWGTFTENGEKQKYHNDPKFSDWQV